MASASPNTSPIASPIASPDQSSLPPPQIPICSPKMTESSPYFLHSGDNPGTVLVSQVLHGENYPIWSRSMLMALNTKNKVGFIDESIIKPSTSDPNFAVWTRCNDMVISWIINSISKDLASSIILH